MLGVERKATPEATRLAVKRAYRKLARQYHPDLNKHADAADMMRRINQAYQAILVGL
ncbi:MAG: DnaJ domain-containing protein [Anaerolineae bacterium]|nr:DnaJ domain-containing protein [Anaerolineae bacterium]